eukprot:gene2454-3188_t
MSPGDRRGAGPLHEVVEYIKSTSPQKGDRGYNLLDRTQKRVAELRERGAEARSQGSSRRPESVYDMVEVLKPEATSPPRRQTDLSPVPVETTHQRLADVREMTHNVLSATDRADKDAARLRSQSPQALNLSFTLARRFMEVNNLWMKFRQEEGMRNQAVKEAGLVWTALEESELERSKMAEQRADDQRRHYSHIESISESFQEVMKRYSSKQLMSTVWMHWRIYQCAHNLVWRRHTRKCIRFIRYWSQLHALLRWWRWNSLMFRVRRLVGYGSKRQVRTVFFSWKQWLENGLYKAQGRGRALRVMWGNRTRRFLGYWVLLTRERTVHRGVAVRACMRLGVSGSGGRFQLRAWRDFTRASTSQRRVLTGKQGKAVSALLNRRSRAAMTTWVARMVLARRLRHHVARLFAGKLGAAFNSWAQQIRWQQCSRGKLGAALARLRNAVIGAAIGKWIHVYRVARFARKRVLFKGWGAWAEAADSLRHMRRIGAKVVVRLAQRQMVMAFDSWCNVGQELKTIRHKAGKAAAMFTQRHVAMAWAQWRDVRVKAKGSKALLMRLLQIQLVAAMNAWVDSVGYARRIKGILRRIINAKLAAGFQMWAAGTAERAAAEERRFAVLQKCLARMASRTVHMALTSWVETCERGRAQRELLLKAVRRVQKCGLAAAWNQWAEMCATRHTHRLTLERAVAKMVTREASKAFAQWATATQGAAQRKLRVQRCVAKLMNRGVAMCFASWKGRRRQTLAVGRAAAKLLNRRAAAALETWLGAAESTREAVHKLSKVLRRMKGDLMGAAFCGWIDVISMAGQQLTVAQKCAMNLLQRQTKRAWNAWQDFTSHSVRLKHVLGRAVAKVLQRTLAAAWACWEARLRERHVLKKAVVFMVKHLLHSALRGWRASSEKHLRSQRVLARAVASLIHRSMKHAWLGWQQAVRHHRVWQKQLDESLRMMLSIVVAPAWRTWKAASSAAHDRRLLLQRALLRMSNHYLGSAYATWENAVKDSADRRAMLRRAVAAITKAALGRAFRAWSSGIQDEHLTGLEGTLGKLQNRLLAMALRGWRDNVAQMKQRRGRLQKAAGRLLLRRLLPCWNSWWKLMVLKHDRLEKLRRAVTRLTQLCMAQAWTAWVTTAKTATHQQNLLRKGDTGDHALAAVRNGIGVAELAGYGAAWNAWVFVTKRTVRRANVIGRLRVSLQRRALVEAFATWQELRHERRQHILRAARRWEFSQKSQVSRVMMQWAALSKRDRRVRYLFMFCVQRWRREALMHAMQVWRVNVAQCRGQRYLHSYDEAMAGSKTLDAMVLAEREYRGAVEMRMKNVEEALSTAYKQLHAEDVNRKADQHKMELLQQELCTTHEALMRVDTAALVNEAAEVAPLALTATAAEPLESEAVKRQMDTLRVGLRSITDAQHSLHGLEQETMFLRQRLAESEFRAETAELRAEKALTAKKKLVKKHACDHPGRHATDDAARHIARSARRLAYDTNGVAHHAGEDAVHFHPTAGHGHAQNPTLRFLHIPPEAI